MVVLLVPRPGAGRASTAAPHRRLSGRVERRAVAGRCPGPQHHGAARQAAPRGRVSDDKPTIPTRVEITSGGHQVVIECAGTLAAVSKRALELWRATDDQAIMRGYNTVGFHADIRVDHLEPDGPA
jgi:hypothetical protein